MSLFTISFAVLAILAGSARAYAINDEFADLISTAEDFEDFNVALAWPFNEVTDEKSQAPTDLVVDTITGHGYPVESHTVITDDGYILKMHRIPSSPNQTHSAHEVKQPVLLMHGLLDSSATFVLMGPNQSLAYMLADAGYDVWMGNVRGNRYSRHHVSMNPDGWRSERKRFWDFSWHEMGMFDLPAMIDYVLNSTDFKKLHYIGHSQGTTSFFVMASQRPEYNDKILLMNALAPVAYMEHLPSRLTRAMSLLQPILEASLSIFGVYEFQPENIITRQVTQVLCKEKAMSGNVCQNLVFALCGFNAKMVDKTKVSVIAQHTPAGAATRQLLHYGQLQHRDIGFRAYDHGSTGNLQHYSSKVPLQYPLNDITAPVVLHYGLKDDLVGIVDVQRLAAELPNVVESRQVPHPDFGHTEFVWATEIRPLVYDHMLTLMKAADQNQ